jgi:hypothetical protein
MQVVAVHSVGTFPLVLEIDPSGLNRVQTMALQNLPRSPAGVPELRGLGKLDGEIRFKLKVGADLLTAAHIPELLSLWDSKYTEAKLKHLAKGLKEERAAASAAGLWKEGTDKGDLNAMHDQATPAEAQKFQTELARVREGSAKGKSGARRTSKPKELRSVLLATTEVTASGELRTKESNSDKALASITVQNLIKRMDGGDVVPVEFADPLEVARLAEQAAAGPAPAMDSAPGDQTGLADSHQNAVAPRADEAPPAIEKPLSMPSDAEAMVPEVRAERTRHAIERHKAGKGDGPKLLELNPFDLFAMLDREKGQPAAEVSGGGAKVQEPAPVERPLDQDTPDPDSDVPGACNGDPGYDPAQDPLAGAEIQSWVFQLDPDLLALEGRAGEEAAQATGIEGMGSCSVLQAASIVPEVESGPLQWSYLGTFRLANQLGDARPLVLPTDEMFQALAHLRVTEPLQVHVDWLGAAAAEAGVTFVDQPMFDHANRWMQQQLTWRSKELVKWLAKGDQISPEHAVHGAAPKNKHPKGWVDAGMALAPLAQQIAMDIEMLDLNVFDIDRSLIGMPSWAIEARELMKSFAQAQAETPVAEESAVPGTAFRDCWRAEVLRINQWCAQVKGIKIARQFGLFGSAAEQKLLGRLEEVIQRTKDWQRGGKQASRALAVWIAFVLSLDHGAVAMKPISEAPARRRRSPSKSPASSHPQQEVSHA